MPRILKALIQFLLHLSTQQAIAPGFDDHATAHRAGFRQVGLIHHLLIPFGVVIGAGGVMAVRGMALLVVLEAPWDKALLAADMIVFLKKFGFGIAIVSWQKLA
jgi:hypothetical protein